METVFFMNSLERVVDFRFGLKLGLEDFRRVARATNGQITALIMTPAIASYNKPDAQVLMLCSYPLSPKCDLNCRASSSSAIALLETALQVKNLSDSCGTSSLFSVFLRERDDLTYRTDV